MALTSRFHRPDESREPVAEGRFCRIPRARAAPAMTDLELQALASASACCGRSEPPAVGIGEPPLSVRMQPGCGGGDQEDIPRISSPLAPPPSVFSGFRAETSGFATGAKSTSHCPEASDTSCLRSAALATGADMSITMRMPAPRHESHRVTLDIGGSRLSQPTDLSSDNKSNGTPTTTRAALWPKRRASPNSTFVLDSSIGSASGRFVWCTQT